MLKLRIAIGMAAVGPMFLDTGAVSGQTFPNKPLRIVTAEPGGGNDIAARLMTPGLSASLGQQVIVENRGAAGGVVAAQTVLRAPPDGYTMLYHGSVIWLAPFMRDHVPWDPVRDFSTISLVQGTPMVLLVNPLLPATSVKELIALAKAKPGELNYGSGGSGSANHLSPELFKAMAGVDIMRITYRGAAPALNDLIGGKLQVMFPTVTSGLPHVKSGRLKALAVTSAQPSALAPGLPTVAASGLPGYESVQLSGVFAPVKTPKALINRLNQEIVQVLSKTDVRERLLNAGVEPIGSSAEQFAAVMKSEMVKWGKVIKDAGIREE